TQGYGPTNLVGEPALHGFPHFHTGVDLACPPGTPVISVTSGRAAVGDDPRGYGLWVQAHVGDLWIRYAHLEVQLVRDGEQVVPGTLLGLEGSTGYSTGAHLHFEVDRGCGEYVCSVEPGGVVGVQ